MLKIAETLNLSFDIPESEVKIGKEAIVAFSTLKEKLDAFSKYVDNMFIPFQDHEKVSKESVEKYKSVIWRFKQEITDKFEDLKQISGIGVQKLSNFESDSEITQILSSFINSIQDISKQIDINTEVLSNWDSEKYKEDVIEAMTALKKEVYELSKLIEERIIPQISENIVADSWVDALDPEVVKSIKTRQPLLMQLVNQNKQNLQQALSASEEKDS